jgi:hypothetical protein
MYHAHIAPPKIVVYTQPGKKTLSKVEDNPPPPKKSSCMLLVTTACHTTAFI